jgi:hypothetical protein
MDWDEFGVRCAFQISNGQGPDVPDLYLQEFPRPLLLAFPTDRAILPLAGPVCNS